MNLKYVSPPEASGIMITDIDRMIAIVPAVEDVTALLQIDEFGKADLPGPEINGMLFAF